MSRSYVEPTVWQVNNPTHPTHDTEENHPAYAQIGASRVSGHINLYGSDFDHQHYVTITIRPSVLHRGLNHDWAYGGSREYIEVALSEAQWATFVSAMNTGHGVQCTLQHRDGKDVPQIPRPKDRQAQFNAEANDKLNSTVEALKQLAQAIENTSLSQKSKKELLRKLNHILQDLGPNLKYVAKCFAEHVEGVTEHAKIEVNAYIQARISRAGIAALSGDKPILMLEGDADAEI